MCTTIIHTELNICNLLRVFVRSPSLRSVCQVSNWKQFAEVSECVRITKCVYVHVLLSFRTLKDVSPEEADELNVVKEEKYWIGKQRAKEEEKEKIYSNYTLAEMDCDFVLVTKTKTMLMR